ncbi:TetR family transcriptional regulator [Ectobacillus sp. JY-23]|uniref:TetR family transcriptional regulator n=1 Tax=Ectobacillus sp. JY-23 TaxID=2933872 RepID=UPI001FF5EA58|nr:TetR family transcriptional regulator [Ectobacillus sp. JY-23]UOY90976.1 TetR family transcriptional regulator [Ectobacillus sp. JY-23]
MALTKEMILDTTEQVLRRFGLEKATVVDVARALNVSHGTVYRHFPSKSALREAVAKRWLERISSATAAVCDETEDPKEHLHNWFENLITLKRNKALEDPEMFAVYHALSEESVEVIRAHIEELILQVTEIVEKGMKTGQFKQGQAHTVASAVFYATARFHHPALAKEWVLPEIEQQFQEVWQLILTGLLE